MKIEDPDFECNITAVVGFVSPENQPNNFLMQLFGLAQTQLSEKKP